MKIRYHPKLDWSPSGWYAGEDLLHPPSHDDGILRGVRLVKDGRIPPRDPDYLVLDIEYQGNRFKWSLFSKQDDSAFIKQLHDKLQADCIGRPMRDVWDEEVDF